MATPVRGGHCRRRQAIFQSPSIHQTHQTHGSKSLVSTQTSHVALPEVQGATFGTALLVDVRCTWVDPSSMAKGSIAGSGDSAALGKEQQKKKAKVGDAAKVKKVKKTDKKNSKKSESKASTRKRASEAPSDAHGNSAANGNGASNGHDVSSDATQPAAGKKRKTVASSAAGAPAAEHKDAVDGTTVTLDRLPAAIANRLRAKGITELFPIQQASYGPVKAGHDVVAQARTGCVRRFLIWNSRANPTSHAGVEHA